MYIRSIGKYNEMTDEERDRTRRSIFVPPPKPTVPVGIPSDISDVVNNWHNNFTEFNDGYRKLHIELYDKIMNEINKLKMFQDETKLTKACNECIDKSIEDMYYYLLNSFASQMEVSVSKF